MKEHTVPMEQQNGQGNGNVPPTHDEERMLIPPVDIFEMSEGLAVVVDLPGVEKTDVNVHVENDVLTIKATPTHTLRQDAMYREFNLGTYFRQFQLGEQVDRDKIRADMRHGVLTIRLPKVEKAKPKRIEVSVAG